MGAFELVASGQLLFAVPIALAAGLISFASPCVLPLVPGYLGYVGGFTSGVQQDNRRRLLFGSLLFVLGFAVVFVLAGASFGVIGWWVVQWRDLITRFLGAVVILLGLAFLGRFGFLQRMIKPEWKPATGLAGAPLLGAIFAIGWSPCIGPTYAAIIALASNSASPVAGALLGFVYALGLGIPFVLVAVGFSWATGAVGFLRRHIRAVNLLGGVLLILIGVLMVSGLWNLWMLRLGSVIIGFVPAL